MVTGSYETSPGAYVETLHGARTVPTAEGARATNPRGGKGGNVYSTANRDNEVNRTSQPPEDSLLMRDFNNTKVGPV